jgi:hypothetical protein
MHSIAEIPRFEMMRYTLDLESGMIVQVRVLELQVCNRFLKSLILPIIEDDDSEPTLLVIGSTGSANSV